MYDFITKTKMLWPTLSGSACEISPGYFTHSPDQSESNCLRLFIAIFIITSYEAAYVWLPDAKYRHLLPHALPGTKLGPDQWGGYRSKMHFYFFINHSNTSSNDQNKRSWKKAQEHHPFFSNKNITSAPGSIHFNNQTWRDLDIRVFKHGKVRLSHKQIQLGDRGCGKGL